MICGVSTESQHGRKESQKDPHGLQRQGGHLQRLHGETGHSTRGGLLPLGWLSRVHGHQGPGERHRQRILP